MQKRRETGPTSATRKHRPPSGAQELGDRIAAKIVSKMIHIRVWPIEEAAMRAAAESRGLSLAVYLRLCGLHIAGAPTGAEFDALGLPDAIRHLDGAANNLNQLTRAANRNRGIVMTNQDRLIMVRLGDQIEDVRELLLKYRVTAAKRPGLLTLPDSKGDR